MNVRDSRQTQLLGKDQGIKDRKGQENEGKGIVGERQRREDWLAGQWAKTRHFGGKK